jgi:hypothetical protein
VIQSGRRRMIAEAPNAPICTPQNGSRVCGRWAGFGSAAWYAIVVNRAGKRRGRSTHGPPRRFHLALELRLPLIEAGGFDSYRARAQSSDRTDVCRSEGQGACAGGESGPRTRSARYLALSREPAEGRPWPPRKGNGDMLALSSGSREEEPDGISVQARDRGRQASRAVEAERRGPELAGWQHDPARLQDASRARGSGRGG